MVRAFCQWFFLPALRTLSSARVPPGISTEPRRCLYRALNMRPYYFNQTAPGLFCGVGLEYTRTQGTQHPDVFVLTLVTR